MHHVGLILAQDRLTKPAFIAGPHTQRGDISRPRAHEAGFLDQVVRH